MAQISGKMISLFGVFISKWGVYECGQYVCFQIVDAYEAGADALRVSNKAGPDTGAVDTVMTELEEVYSPTFLIIQIFCR